MRQAVGWEIIVMSGQGGLTAIQICLWMLSCWLSGWCWHTSVISSQNSAHEVFSPLISLTFFSFCICCTLFNKAAVPYPEISPEQQTQARRQQGECNQGADCIIFSFGSRSKPTKTKQPPADGAALAVLHEDAPVLSLRISVKSHQIRLVWGKTTFKEGWDQLKTRVN